MGDAPQRPQAGWFRDPTGRNQGRYWDGQSWTASVVNGGVVTSDTFVPPAPHEESLAKAPADSATRSGSTPASRRAFWIAGGVAAGVAAVVLLGIGAYAVVSMVGSARVAQLASVPATSSAEATVAPIGAAVQSAPPKAAPYPVLEPASDYVYAEATASQKRWALALGGVLTAMNGDSHDTLAGIPEAPDTADALEARMGMWGINDRQDLVETLDWLAAEGDRKEFAEISAALAQATPEQVEAIRAQYKGNAQALAKIDLVLKHGAACGEKSIVAWDVGRYVSLCRWGYARGYLEEDEAWGRIMPVAQAAQGSFGSWSEYGKNYAIGRTYWSGDPKTEADVLRISKQLRSSTGPWGKIAWDTKLGPAQ